MSPGVLLLLVAVVYVLDQIGEKAALFVPYTDASRLQDPCVSMLFKVPKLKSGCCIC